MKKYIIIAIFLLLITSNGLAQSSFDYFDNTYWSIDTYGTWDGSEWDSSSSGPLNLVYLDVSAGGWESGFRPSYIKATFTGASTVGVVIEDSNSNIISYAGSSSNTSGSFVMIGFVGYDIAQLRFLSFSEFSITNIQFYGDSMGKVISYNAGGISITAGGTVAVTGDDVNPGTPPDPGDYTVVLRNNGAEVNRNSGEQVLRNESP